MIKIIVAYDQNRTIGLKGKLPWKFPEDLKHFYDEIENKNILVGKKTFLSLNLSFFKNNKIVVLSDEVIENNKSNVFVYNSVEKILKDFNFKELYICGGAEIYTIFLPYAQQLIITKIKGEYEGDRYFPNWNEQMFKIIKTKKLSDNCTVFYYQKCKLNFIKQ